MPTREERLAGTDLADRILAPLEPCAVVAREEEIETCSLCDESTDNCECRSCDNCGERYTSRNGPECSCTQCENCEEWDDNCTCSTCDYCGERFSSNRQGCCERICRTCFGRGRANHYHCSSCSEAIDENDWTCINCNEGECCSSRSHCDEGHCEGCCNCETEPDSDVIEGYSSRNYPPARPYRPTNTPFLYLGVELEVECPNHDRDSVAESIHSKHSDALLLKEDGSLNSGFEMVTGKYSLENHQKIWQDITRTALNAGARSWKHKTTGLHVHLSRNYFTPLALGKFLVFINSDRNRNEIVKLAGRSCPEYAALEKKKLTDVRAVEGNGRYQSVNLENSRTVEVRIFKGTLKYEHVLCDIEFCHAVAMWCCEVSIPDLEDWATFKAWVIKRKKTYKFLSTYFKLGFFSDYEKKAKETEEVAA